MTEREKYWRGDKSPKEDTLIANIFKYLLAFFVLLCLIVLFLSLWGCNDSGTVNKPSIDSAHTIPPIDTTKVDTIPRPDNKDTAVYDSLKRARDYSDSVLKELFGH